MGKRKKHYMYRVIQMQSEVIQVDVGQWILAKAGEADHVHRWEWLMTSAASFDPGFVGVRGPRLCSTCVLAFNQARLKNHLGECVKLAEPDPVLNALLKVLEEQPDYQPTDDITGLIERLHPDRECSCCGESGYLGPIDCLVCRDGECGKHHQDTRQPRIGEAL